MNWAQHWTQTGFSCYMVIHVEELGYFVHIVYIEHTQTPCRYEIDKLSWSSYDQQIERKYSNL